VEKSIGYIIHYTSNKQTDNKLSPS